MTSYDYIVVGSGIAGLTVTRILAAQGLRVMLLEQSPTLGGSAKRFHLQGVPFDIGFHFTGGFADDGKGILDEMLALLGVSERIRPIYYPRNACHRIIFPSQGMSYMVPCGLQNIQDGLSRDFPKHREGIGRYFHRVREVIARTPALSVSGFAEVPLPLDEDSISLQAVMDECIPDRLLQAIVGGFCMCYGSRPDEVAFSTHSRISAALHESLAKVEDGGQAFVDALVAVIHEGRVEIRTGVTLETCGEIKNRKAGRFVLTDGSEVGAGGCIFTVHPRNILTMIPAEHLSKAFRSRVMDFEPSIGFFALFGTMDAQPGGGLPPITSVFPDLDLNAMLTCRTEQPVDGPIVVIRGTEQANGSAVETVTALEVTFPKWMKPWEQSCVGRRPEEYYRYKQARIQSIVGRMEQSLPEFRGRLKLLDASSSLTFRDYLNSPDGAAYGIRQKIGQFNVMGRLPIANLYAVGQCALLPGIVGAMTSAFLVCRSILEKKTFGRFLEGKTCR